MRRSLILLAALVLVILGCSDDESNITEPEIIDDPSLVSLERTHWTWASAPFQGDNYLANNSDQRSFDPVDRVKTIRWFLPRDRTLRRYLNPDLVNEERDETQPSMELYLRAEDGVWDPEDWGGIMQGTSRCGMDNSWPEYVEIWINDGIPDSTQRRGKLHLDFGYINEDGFWPLDHDGSLVVGEWEREDGIIDGLADGVFVTPEEDIGLDGNEHGPQRYDASFEVNGDSPYPYINGTARNNREDSEDLDENGHFSSDDGYFTVSVDLQKTEALIDVVYDYENVADLVAGNIAWRKYRIPLTERDSVARETTGLLTELTHLRIWYEDSSPGGRSGFSIQLSGFRFPSAE